MNRRTIHALGAATALALSPLAMAGEEQPAVEVGTTDATVTTDAVEFTELDANGDGFVAQAEIPTELELAQVWVEFDADADMKLSQSEFDAWVAVDEDQ